MSIKRGVIIVSAALLLAAAAGCGASATTHRAAASGPRHGGTLTVGIDSDLVTLNPAMSSALIDRQAFINIFDPLLKLSRNMQIEPNLITKWKITHGGKTYTFTLRKGVKFQDGTPFNAQAIIYNWRWDMSPKNASPRATNLDLVTGLRAPNPYTLVVNLKAPFSPFLSILTGRTGMINSPAAIKKEGAHYSSRPVGTGPFEVVSWNPQGNLVLKRNPHYWQKGLPYLNKVIYTPIIDPQQEYNSLITGQTQLVDSVAYQFVSTLSHNHAINSASITGLGYSSMEINTKQGPLKNFHNREAIDYAINREALIKLIYFGHTIPAYEEYPPSSWAYNKNLRVPFSDALAKKQLKLAGNPQGFNMTLQGNNDPVTEQEMQAIQSELGKVGIKVTIQPVDFTTLLTNAIKGNFQTNLLGWSGRPDPDQNSFEFDTTGGSFNYTGWSNATENRLLRQAREFSNQKVRAELYNEAAQVLLQQAPYIFLTYTPVIQAWAKNVMNYYAYPDDLMRLASVWLK